MKFEWITDWETIWSDDFVSKWRKWMDLSDTTNIFYNPEFCKVWIDTYKDIRTIKPLFCIATDKNNNIVFFPLVIWEKDWKSAFEKVIIPVGYSDYDYNSPLIIGKDIDFDLFWKQLIDTIFKEFKNEFDTLELTGVREKYISNNKNWTIDDVCPIIELENFTSYNSLLESLKSKERGDINRQTRRLKEFTDYEFKVYKKNELKDAIKMLPKILYHHSLRWPNAYKAPNYHYNLLENLLPLGFVHLSEIRVNNEAISWNLSFQYKGIYYFYMPTYDEKYKKYSPGKINMFLALEDTISKGFSKFDMLKGAENYKNKLPIQENKVYKLILNNDTLLSKLKRQLLNVKSKIK